MSTYHAVDPGWLRKARTDAGLSRQRLAERAGCSIGYLTLLERGYVPKTSDVLPRIERALLDHVPTNGNGTPPRSAVTQT